MADTGQGSRGIGRERLQRFITSHQIDAEIIIPGEGTPTVPAAAEALGVRPEQIIKSLVFNGRSGENVIAIVRGTGKVDRRKLSRTAGLRKPRLAPPDVVHRSTGYEAGGTPPIGHCENLRVYMDDAVFEEPVVFGGGGDVNALLRIRPETIRELTSATVADICEDEE